MKSMLYPLIIALLLITTASALEVKTKYEYYTVSLEGIGSVSDHIFASAERSTHGMAGKIRGSRTLGEYTPKIDTNIGYARDFLGNCTVNLVEINLQSEFVSPQLDKNSYSDRELRDFQREYDKIYNHEKTHEEIYINGLTQLEKKIYALGAKKTHCNDLKANVDRLEDSALKELKEENWRFDCQEYGRAQGVVGC